MSKDQNEKMALGMTLLGGAAAALLWIMYAVALSNAKDGTWTGSQQLLNDPSSLSGLAWFFTVVAVIGLVSCVILVIQEKKG